MSGHLSRAAVLQLAVVVLICSTIGLWGVWQLSEREGLFRETFELRVGFAQVHDIDEGTPVRIRGFNVGQVVAIEYPDHDSEDGQTKVWVRIRVDQKFQNRLYADAQATIHSKGLLSTNVIAIQPGTPKKGPLIGDELAAVEPTDLTQVAVKLQSVADRADTMIADIQKSQGTIIKLLKDDSLYHEIKGLAADTRLAVRKADDTLTAMRGEVEGIRSFVRTSEETARSLQQDAEAIKKLPLLRGYVEDAATILVRPNFETRRYVYNTADLFEPGTATLSETGLNHLTAMVTWLNENKIDGSEVVVVTYSDPKDTQMSAAAAKTLTHKQSESLAEYLKEQGVHKMGWRKWWNRKVIPLGMGSAPPPVVEKEVLPPNHTEFLLYLPRS